MISRQLKFIFVHIPKTGGNSLQNILRHYSEDNVTVYGKTLHEIEALLSTQDKIVIHGPMRASSGNKYIRHSVTVTDVGLLDDLGVANEKLGTEKHASIGEYRNNWDTEYFGDFGEYFKFSIIRNPWERMVSYYWSPCFGMETWDKTLFLRMLSSLDTDFAYIQLNGAMAMDHLIRFENIQEDFDKVCDMIGISQRPLPVTNRSSRKYYRDYYDDESRERVREKFRKEIEYFNYTF